MQRRSRRAESSHLRQRKQIGERRERQDGNLQKTRRASSASPISAATASPSAPNRIRAVIVSVRRLISRAISMVSPSCHRRALDAERRHDAGIFVQTHAMKDRLNEPPLARVQRAVARQQPVAEKPPRAAQRSPFDEPMMVARPAPARCRRDDSAETRGMGRA